MADKSATAYRTIGEVARELGVPQHRLRYWESRFPQVKPVTRAGDRRYYAPADVDLLRRIHTLLGQDGYTVRGVQALLTREAEPRPPSRVDELHAVRRLLSDALAEAG